MPHALIVEDDPNSLSGLAAILDADGFSVDTATCLAEARQALERFIPDVVLIDLNLPDGKGLDLLPSLPLQPPNGTVPVIVMTGNATVESAIEGLRHGIWDYLLKPISIPRLRSLLARIPRPYELTEEVQSLKATLRQLGRFGPLVGRSMAMQAVYDEVERLALTEAPVLVVGEDGSGKETVARAIHHGSRRRKAPFVAFDCRQSERRPASGLLFGQERGTMPPMHASLGEGRSIGAFERAMGGTLFLDEITQLPLEQQQLLVNTLDTHVFKRVGGTTDVSVDFRLIVSTSENPSQALAEGRLLDALYRLVEEQIVSVPTLRARPEDVDLLAHYFVEQLNQREETAKRLAPSALRGITGYEWPGNIRELREAIETACRLSDEVIEALELAGGLDGSGAKRSGSSGSVEIAVGMPLADVEELLIRATLDAVGGTRHRAASMLGISPKTLYNKLQRMKME